MTQPIEFDPCLRDVHPIDCRHCLEGAEMSEWYRVPPAVEPLYLYRVPAEEALLMKISSAIHRLCTLR